jgi:hypothetical protein
VLAFAVFTVVDTSRWRQGRTWLELWATGAAVALVTLLFAPDANAQQRLVLRFASGTSVASVFAARHLESLWALAIPLVWCALAIVGALWTRTLRTTLAVAAFVVLLLVATVWASSATVTMIVLSVVAGYGVAWCERRWQRPAMVAAVLSVVAMVIMLPWGVRMDAPAVATTLAAPPAYLTPAASLPTIYRAVETLSRSAVLAEFPFGDSGYDLRYMFFSTTHRRRLLNGYSKTSPPTFLARQRVLAQPLLDPAIAAQALAGATHVIVHRHAWKDNTGLLVGGWLEAFGARAVAEGDGAVLYELAANEGLARTN